MVLWTPEAETGICSHDVSLNMVRDLFGRGLYVKYIINISNYITGITINQINLKADIIAELKIISLHES
jgi:hypothetical protein